jgi:hypothetical protein
VSFGVSKAESRPLNGEAGGVVGVCIGRRGGRAPVPCHVGGARDVLRDLLRARDRGVADVVGRSGACGRQPIHRLEEGEEQAGHEIGVEPDGLV